MLKKVDMIIKVKTAIQTRFSAYEPLAYEIKNPRPSLAVINSPTTVPVRAKPMHKRNAEIIHGRVPGTSRPDRPIRLRGDYARHARCGRLDLADQRPRRPTGRQLSRAQSWFNASRMDVAQTIRSLIIKTMNPIAQGLAIHPTYAGGVRPVHAIQHGGK